MKKNKLIKNNKSKIPKEIMVNYIKTNNYRSYHVDGILGGLTPSGKIYAELFLQRSVTPTTVTHKIKDGALNEEIGRTGKEGIVREIESGIIMDIETAILFKDWLESKISAYDDLKKGLKKKK